LLLSKLNINAVAINKANPSWAPAMNTDPNWQLVQVDTDSQLYLRKENADREANRKLFMQWEAGHPNDASQTGDVAAEIILRGLYLRPDAESLAMLGHTGDVLWIEDPEILYVEEWLQQVPAPLAIKALGEIPGNPSNSQLALRMILLLRLDRGEEATAFARGWHPSRLNLNSQHLEMLRAEALVKAGDLQAARAILESLWPAPRYSLRWARLCEKIYADDPKAMPKNARLLTEMADQAQWQDETLAVLNQNILRLSAK
jgi:hypothetical protein